ncbi:MAG: hypothetical protein LBF12_00650 [Christensenellaceae bacterium]|nr:hypothetical protein [Christensenellaceae bacterium]
MMNDEKKKLNSCMRLFNIILVILLTTLFLFSCSDESETDRIKREFTEQGFTVSETSDNIESIELLGLNDRFYLTHQSQPHAYAAILIFDTNAQADIAYFSNKEIIEKQGRYVMYAIIKKGGTGDLDIFRNKFKEIVHA